MNPLADPIFRLLSVYMYLFFFFSSRRRHTRFDCDWSSDVCSSDLEIFFVFNQIAQIQRMQPLHILMRRDQIHDVLIGHELASNGVEDHDAGDARSEERRVGKECRSRWSPYH